MTKQFENTFNEAMELSKNLLCTTYGDDEKDAIMKAKGEQLFNLAKNGVWHKPDEEPKEGVEILFAWASASRLKIFHDIGYYDRILNHIATQRITWSLPEIERWAYLSDIDHDNKD